MFESRKLITTLRCWWPILYNKKVINLMILSPSSLHCHEYKVINIKLSPTWLKLSTLPYLSKWLYNLFWIFFTWWSIDSILENQKPINSVFEAKMSESLIQKENLLRYSKCWSKWFSLKMMVFFFAIVSKRSWSHVECDLRLNDIDYL